jgi:hypothetical protein
LFFICTFEEEDKVLKSFDKKIGDEDMSALSLARRTALGAALFLFGKTKSGSIRREN